MAPDCETKAACPNGGIEGANVAFIEQAGSAFNTPMQFGPTIRMRAVHDLHQLPFALHPLATDLAEARRDHG
jgi:hypothetical protein